MQLSARMVREKLKLGWTSQMFAEACDVTEEQFLNFLNKNFKSDSSIRRNLKANEKRASAVITDDTELSSSSIPLEYEDEVAPVVANEPEKISTSNDTEDISAKLEQLQSEENCLITTICEHEVVHEKLVQKRKLLFDSLREQKQSLLELRTLVAKHEAEVENSILQLNSTAEQLSEINSKLSTLNEQLSDVQSEIKSLKKIYIYAFSDGSIAVENFEDKIPALEDCTTLVQQLSIREEPEFEEITTKELRQLARLMAFTQTLKQNNLSFEITFDSAALQRASEVSM